ncbi:MAG: rhamnogalacturonan acetylesterase [Aristaeellaceae bacterium]
MPTIYIIGDSTVEDNTPPFRGWGWALPDYVAPGVQVANHAMSGRSSLSFMNEGRFVPVEEGMQPGDLLLIQFGHNDEKDDAERHTDPATTFPRQLSRYCDAALAKGAQPVLMTPVCRRFFVGADSILYTHGEYPAAIRHLAAERGIPLLDLKQASRALYLSLGEEKTAELFVRLAPGEHPDFPDGHDDKTHFNAHGAQVIAGLVADLMRRQPACAPFLKTDA